MSVNVKELHEHMAGNGFGPVVVEVVDVNVPAFNKGYNKRKPRVLAKRLVIIQSTPGNQYASASIEYAMYNSFKKSDCYVPDDFQFEILTDAVQTLILGEYKEHKDGLEKDFRDAFDNVHGEIQTKLNAATELLKEARKLSEDNGVPFMMPKDLSPCAPDAGYLPISFAEKYDAEVMMELATELTGIDEGANEGWNWYNSDESC